MKRSLEALDNQAFDLLVVGGGITGAGVALDAATRGLRVALLDKGDFASGTSNISSKLVHGGLRYLEQGDLRLVYEALQERARLLRNAPHLVWPLPFVLPFREGDRVPPWKWRVGLALYDLLAGRANLRRSRTVPLPRLRRTVPALRPEGLRGGATFADAQMDDARLCLAVLQTAVAHGALAANHVEVVEFLITAGRVAGARAVDRLTGRSLILQARQIVNATGPWSDAVRRLAGEPEAPFLAPTRGVHLILPDQKLPAGLLLLHPRDGHVFFVLPWLGKTLLGTTDNDFTGSPDQLAVTEEEINYLLEGYQHHLQPALGRSDLLGTFIGVRPLIRARPGEPTARSRDFQLLQGRSGLLSVIGGKYTTYRHMAERVTNLVMQRLGRPRSCRTRDLPLEGSPTGGWDAFVSRTVGLLQGDLGLPVATARHLVGRYGTRAPDVAGYAARDPALARPVIDGEPDLEAEFVYQREREMAQLPEDFLVRRTKLAWFHPGLVLSEQARRVVSSR
jgi:glycerol-3-phosphate dehydrogenase